MARISVSVTETINIPDDAQIDFAPTGVVTGFRLADGRLVRTWISYEIEERDGSNRDLTYDELDALDIGAADNTERHIEHVNL